MYLWRNHYPEDFSRTSPLCSFKKYFARRNLSHPKYRHAVVMPVGVNAELFAPSPAAHGASASERTPRSILFFSRFAPAKKPDILLEALGALSKEGIQFEASFYGTALPRDADYRDRVIARARELGLSERVKFHLGVPHTEAPTIFSTHEIFVNLSSSGTYDKTMFEAAACGCVVIASSRDFAAIVGERFLVADNDANAPAANCVSSSHFQRMNAQLWLHSKGAQCLRGIVSKLSESGLQRSWLRRKFVAIVRLYETTLITDPQDS